MMPEATTEELILPQPGHPQPPPPPPHTASVQQPVYHTYVEAGAGEVIRTVQLRHALRSQIPLEGLQLMESSVESLVRSTDLSKPTSTLYYALLSNLPSPLDSALDKWKALIPDLDQGDWEEAIDNLYSSVIDSKGRLIQAKWLYQVYLTPARLKRMGLLETDLCLRCKVKPGTLIHVVWECRVISRYWDAISSFISTSVGLPIRKSAALCLLSIVEPMLDDGPQRTLLRSLMFYARKCILLNWKHPRCGIFIALSSVIAAISGLLVGYELGIISGALLQLHSLLELSCQQQELIVSALLIGALLASLVGGFLIDFYGRRITIIFTSCLLGLSNLLLITVVSYKSLIAGRILVGISISLSAIATCVYIAEIAPHHKRGMLVSLNELMIVVGILMAYIINYLLAAISNGWQYMFGIIIPLAALQALAMYFLPPSPRFLVMKGHEEAAGKVLQRLRATSQTNEELTAIKSSIKAEYQYSFWDLFSSRDNMRTRLIIGIALSFFVQITGQPNILFYASTVLKSVGYESNEAATLASTGIGVVKVVSTIPATFFVDKVGSKTFLSVGSAVMAASLIMMGIISLNIDVNFNNICKTSLHLNHSFEDYHLYRSAAIAKSNESLGKEFSQLSSSWTSLPSNLQNERQTDSWTIPTGTSPSKVAAVTAQVQGVPVYMKWLYLASLLIYVAAFSIGLGPMAWLLQSEIFPAGIKGRAFAITSSMNWGMNLVISLSFLTLTETVGLPWMISFYAVMSIISFVFVTIFVPNTKGRSLEDISMDLANS
ncbi:solute carrier family 2, facilitated glucose transporter member 12 [Gastrophryne carolinensis]